MKNDDPGQGFLGRSMTIGTLLGTKVRIHWTFAIFLAWIGIGFLVQGGVAAAIGGIGFMLALFACVLAHEFGHIAMARRFGVRTADVTLLPIGGVARLERIPEQPGRELAVALAGPAVNLIIAAVLMLGLGVQPIEHTHAMSMKVENILPNLATANLFLALFNLLPAFPMDGGRALRSLLALRLDRVKATRIAATIGQAVAIGLGLLGLISGNPLLIFIAFFVYLGAGAEAEDTKLQKLAESMCAGQAMVTELAALAPDSRLHHAVELLLRTTQREFPVLDDDGRPVGLLTRDQLVRGLHAHGNELGVAEIMDTRFPVVAADSPLSEAVRLMQVHPKTAVAVVDELGRFGGLLTQENLGELVLTGDLPRGHDRPVPDEAKVPRVVMS